MIDHLDPAIRELIAIRKLLVLGLQRLDLASQAEIAEILGVDRSTVARMHLGQTKPDDQSR